MKTPCDDVPRRGIQSGIQPALSIATHQATVSFGRPQQRCIGRRRIDHRGSERALICDRQADDLRFRNGAVGRVLCRRNDEIAHAAALQFGRAPDDGKRGRGNPRFEACGAVGFGWHHRTPLSAAIVR